LASQCFLGSLEVCLPVLKLPQPAWPASGGDRLEDSGRSFAIIFSWKTKYFPLLFQQRRQVPTFRCRTEVKIHETYRNLWCTRPTQSKSNNDLITTSQPSVNADFDKTKTKKSTHLSLRGVIKSLSCTKPFATTTTSLSPKTKMKFATTALTLASLLLASPLALARSLKSDDLEGTVTIKTGDCDLECDWGANEDRRRLGNSKDQVMTMVTFARQQRTLGVVLANIECTVTIGEDEFSKTIPFPDGWTEVNKEADDADDYYGFATSFTVRHDAFLEEKPDEVLSCRAVLT
jgi:hypothetical protein